MDKKDVDETASLALNGLYEYTRMYFGLENDPATLQRAMDVVLATVKWQYAFVYIGDVFIYLKTSKEHLHHIEEILKILNILERTIMLRMHII